MNDFAMYLSSLYHVWKSFSISFFLLFLIYVYLLFDNLFEFAGVDFCKAQI